MTRSDIEKQGLSVRYMFGSNAHCVFGFSTWEDLQKFKSQITPGNVGEPEVFFWRSNEWPTERCMSLHGCEGPMKILDEGTLKIRDEEVMSLTMDNRNWRVGIRVY